MEKNSVTLDTIVALAKRRGFVFPGSEIYGGLAGTFDYGPIGAVLKENIKNLWWRMFVDMRDDMYRLDAAILMNPKAWEASGHVSGFSDPLVECANCKKRFRADQLEDPNKCLSCGKEHTFGEVRQFNMMFATKAGATDDESATVYLRPETAGGIFVNFKNVVDSMHPKLPFGIAQIGKAFRNEIAPRDFIFRLRELEQMEIEYFVPESAWKDAFEMWQKLMHSFANALGLSGVHELEVEDADLAHYSKRTIDFEFEYPFGRKELWGLAYRTNFDLSAHQEASGAKLEYLDEETKEKFVPHVIEPSLGVDRTLLAVLLSAYREDELGGETRVVLQLPAAIAPVKAMVAPLLKNKPELVEKARLVRAELQKVHPAIAWDDNGNIGKRYRRQDEIGTPFCITIDFDTLGENPELLDTVTLRHRDSGEQERVTVAEAAERIRSSLI
ncbi:MAG TPA: glycine--tRNA ligase [Candidatus Paceibacterota bacterium]|jgi:glycyl-tRNA synthetase|nr:glycine--tRNA ligase [Candidatus Paceibacterota bacterium]